MPDERVGVTTIDSLHEVAGARLYHALDYSIMRGLYGMHQSLEAP